MTDLNAINILQTNILQNQNLRRRLKTTLFRVFFKTGLCKTTNTNTCSSEENCKIKE